MATTFDERLGHAQPPGDVAAPLLDEHLASVLAPRSFESDQYRVLRHFLEQARAQRRLDVLAVTSPAAGDGKTVTAINLAATLARSGRSRVLLVDADLRRPFVATNLGLEAGPGLVGALLDESLDLAAVVRRTAFHLDVLPAGVPPADAYHVLESPRLGQILEAARAAYDYVLLDTPPLLLVPDCRVLSRWTDGFLVVVAAHRTPRKLLAGTLSALEQERVVGIVFNGDDRPLHGYYNGGYGGYHRSPGARALAADLALDQPPTREATAMALKMAVLEALAVLGAVSTLQLWAMPDAPSLRAAAAGALALWTVTAFYYAGLYDMRGVRSLSRWAHRLPFGLLLALVPLLAGHTLFPGPPLPVAAYGTCLLIALGLLLAVRATACSLLGSGPLTERVLIVGCSPLAQQLVREIHARPDLCQRVVGVVDDGPCAEGSWHGLGGLSDLRRVVHEVRPHRVILALSARRGHMPLKTLLDLRVRGVAVEDGTEAYERLTGKIAVESLTPSSLIFGRAYRGFRLDLVFGRALSLPLSAAALLLLAPLMALIALAIKLDSRGPVLFVHERMGRGGRTFRLLKFRTMKPASSATSEWARDNTSRLTRLGAWLRRFRLDELPQIVNILRGDMNLVGPRPHPASNFCLLVLAMRNTPQCGESIPYYALRSLVRPGITGWAQVRYRYANDLSEEMEKIKYDLYYVKHMSLRLDLQILLETVKIVLRGHESAHALPARAAAAPAAHRPALSLLTPAVEATSLTLAPAAGVLAEGGDAP